MRSKSGEDVNGWRARQAVGATACGYGAEDEGGNGEEEKSRRSSGDEDGCRTEGLLVGEDSGGDGLEEEGEGGGESGSSKGDASRNSSREEKEGEQCSFGLMRRRCCGRGTGGDGRRGVGESEQGWTDQSSAKRSIRLSVSSSVYSGLDGGERDRMRSRGIARG